MKALKQAVYSGRRTLAGLLIFIVILSASVTCLAAESFTFLALGDTRPETYLPGGKAQWAQMKKVLSFRYKKEPTKVSFSPDGLSLVSLTVPKGKHTSYTLHYKDGWPASIIKTQKGKSRLIMTDLGRKWVMDQVVSSIMRGLDEPDYEPLFCLHGGDFVLHGFQGADLATSPYWQLFDKELLSRLPPVYQDSGIPGRVLGAVGNHETWGDSNLTGMLEAMPWLGDLGLAPDRRVYDFAYKNCRFIFLDTGGYCESGTCWDTRYPTFSEQMAYLTKKLQEAKDSKAEHVVVVYHKPSFVKTGHDPLPPGQNPHKYLKAFADDFNITVVNSHCHTTEHFLVDKVRYLVLGAGGAPQKFKPAKKPSPEKELYWNGMPRVLEYSFLKIEVDGPRMRGVLHRFRPLSPLHPFSKFEMFNITVEEEERT